MIIDDEMCELCQEAMAVPYDPIEDEAYCATCKMMMLTFVSLEDFLAETDQEHLEHMLTKMVHRGDFLDDGVCYYSTCKDYALPRHQVASYSRRSVIKHCTRHAVEEVMPHLEHRGH